MEFLLLLQVSLYRSVYVMLPFLICLTSILLLDRLAPQWGLLDKPDARKQHDGTIPLIGGPAMYLAIASTSLMLAFHIPVIVFLVLGGGLIALGIADDRLDLPARYRLMMQAAIALAMVLIGQIQIAEIGNLFGLGPVVMGGMISLIFTVVCTIGVINAVNMIDGIDGLAGCILLVSFIGMAVVSMSGGNVLGARLLAIFSGALLAFLCFNARVFVRRAHIFMGDSGSMLMGFILAWFLINMTQGDNATMSAVTAGWIFGLPLIDIIAVMLTRIREGRSALAASRDHLHHRLLDHGLSVNQAVLTMTCLHAGFVLIGVLANGNSAIEPFLFWGFVLIVGLHALYTPAMLDRWLGKSHG